MGLLKIFSGRKPEEYEQKGDALFEEKEYGAAKSEYDAALSKLMKASPDNEELKERLQQKITRTRNNLARRHQQAGKELLDSETYEDAEDKLRLALELAEDPELIVEIEEQLREIDSYLTDDVEDIPELDLREEDTEDPDYQEQVEEYFTALCCSLSEEMAQAYQSYGSNFRVGYVALNHGDFDLALTKLSQAMEEDSYQGSFIPLEVAKAYLNLGQYEATVPLLTDLLKAHPDLLQGHQLLCEAYWELEEFDSAQQLLSSCPPELADSPIIHLLRGETLFQAKRYEEAKLFYLDYLNSFGWNEHIARALAITYEALGEKKRACDLFSEILDECRGCGFRADPFIKQKYADLCLELEEYSDRVLELYISLVHEDPDNRASYYSQISRLYSERGNDEEARRYAVFARKLAGEKEKPGGEEERFGGEEEQFEGGEEQEIEDLEGA